MDSMDLLHYLQILKMFILTSDTWEIDRKSYWQEMIWENLRTLWIYWVFQRFCETTWNWTVFWFYVNCDPFMFLPLGCDMWLPGDYPARYYSLCDLGILAPIFVMVISFGFVSAMSSVFVTTMSYDLRLDFQVLEWCFDSSQ